MRQRYCLAYRDRIPGGYTIDRVSFADSRYHLCGAHLAGRNNVRLYVGTDAVGDIVFTEEDSTVAYYLPTVHMITHSYTGPFTFAIGDMLPAD